MREKQRLDLLKLQSADGVEFKEKKKKERGAHVLVKKGSYTERLLQAGIELPAKLYIIITVGISVFVSYLALILGPVLSVFLYVAVQQYLLFGYVDERSSKRKRKVVPQLPAFIDGLASALGTGFNTEGAIIQATIGVPPGVLRTELDRVVNALNRGFSIPESIAVLKQRVAGKEVTSIAVALTLFSSMGGTLLEPFKRLARKIREQQQVVEKAGRDLVQVKQAFIILIALSMGTPAILSLVQPEYIGKALTSGLGRMVLQVAVIMQILAILLFKRITNLRM